jgi:hypothetical protein
LILQIYKPVNTGESRSQRSAAFVSWRGIMGLKIPRS